MTLAFRPARVKKRVSLEITPLIDVLFLLIIFFTMTSTFKRVGELELSLPDSTTAAARKEGDSNPTVELVVLENGTVELDGEPVTLEGLESALRARHEAEADASVLVNAESAVEHGTVVRVLDAVRSAGYRGAGIGTHVPAVGAPRSEAGPASGGAP